MIRETPNTLETLPPDEEGANKHSAASANSAVAAFYEIEDLGNTWANLARRGQLGTQNFSLVLCLLNHFKSQPAMNFTKQACN